MKKLMIFFCCVLAVLGLQAQTLLSRPDHFLVGWEVAIPTNDLIKKTSWAGGHFEYRRMIKPNISAGIGGSWNSFEDYTGRKTYQKPDGSGAVTTDLVKTVYTVPITVNAHYYFLGKSKLVPYAGIGLGTEYTDQTLYFNIFSAGDNNWGFVARPELGLMYPVQQRFGLYLNAAFNYASNKNEFTATNNLSHVAFSIGCMF